MTNSLLHSDNSASHESRVTIESRKLPGVRFTIRRISFGRRLELARAIRTLDRKLEFVRGGEDAVSRVDAAILSREIDKIYLAWGLVSVIGLDIDGEAATPELMIESGPEAVTQEALEAIRAECFLSEEERKN